MTALESGRLIMRGYCESDLDDYHRLLSDKKNMYFLLPITTNTVEESRKSLQDAVDINAKGKARRYFIALKENNKLIGAVDYEIAPETPVGKVANPRAGSCCRNIKTTAMLEQTRNVINRN